MTRQRVDAWAAKSWADAEAAISSGRFNDEIVPTRATIIDPKTGAKSYKLITTDDPLRKTNLETLAKLKPAFPKFGPVTTAGNASQITDGAAALLVMTRRKARELNLPILAKYIACSVRFANRCTKHMLKSVTDCRRRTTSMSTPLAFDYGSEARI